MKLSVIIPCYNTAATIPTQLDALAQQEWSGPWEVIIADNGSTDGSRDVANTFKTKLPEFRIIDASDKRGAAHARNVGASVATGDVLLFCDADDEAGPGWLAAMGEALSKHDFVACRAEVKKFKPPWGTDTYEQEHGLLKIDFAPYCTAAAGGTLGVKKSTHVAVGGFDETFRAQEDLDYCIRTQLKGSELHFVPNALMHMRQRPTLRQYFKQSRQYAIYEVLLKHRYDPVAKMSARNWSHNFRLWKELFIAIRYLREQKVLAAWLRDLAYQIGYLLGSLKFRVHPPALFSRSAWMNHMRNAVYQITTIIPRTSAFSLADSDMWRETLTSKGYAVVPFLERDGQYWGPPVDDESAILELERQRSLGVKFIVVGFPVFWWISYYFRFFQFLHSTYKCILRNDLIIVFSLEDALPQEARGTASSRLTTA